MFIRKNEVGKYVLNSNYILQNTGDLIVKHAVIRYPNFSGSPTRYNPAGGKRTFVLAMTPEVGADLQELGWNVKFRDPEEEGELPYAQTEVVVNMNSEYPPIIHRITEFAGKRSRTKVTEDDIDLLDGQEYEDVSVAIHPFHHGRENAVGATIKGYLRNMDIAIKDPDIFAAEFEESDDDAEFEPFD